MSTIQECALLKIICMILLSLRPSGPRPIQQQGTVWSPETIPQEYDTIHERDQGIVIKRNEELFLFLCFASCCVNIFKVSLPPHNT
jgi:hypothetical protein